LARYSPIETNPLVAYRSRQKRESVPRTPSSCETHAGTNFATLPVLSSFTGQLLLTARGHARTTANHFVVLSAGNIVLATTSIGSRPREALDHPHLLIRGLQVVAIELELR
jgi:hypothetical protein